MKRTMMALAVALLVGTTAMAQDDSKKEKKFDKTEMIQKMTERTVKQYGLDDDQAAKLLKLNTEYAGKMGPMDGPGRGPGGPGRGPRGGNNDSNSSSQERPELTDEQKAEIETRMKEMKANQEAYQKELQSIMTADQFKNYQADQQKRKNRGGGRPQQNKE